ncbi:MAG: hypothetical protein QF734_06505, partial [Arenicellales bacterium]|nr:hypothetical protein [Arenicellales bacterium]
ICDNSRVLAHAGGARYVAARWITQIREPTVTKAGPTPIRRKLLLALTSALITLGLAVLVVEYDLRKQHQDWRLRINWHEKIGNAGLIRIP